MRSLHAAAAFVFFLVTLLAGCGRIERAPELGSATASPAPAAAQSPSPASLLPPRSAAEKAPAPAATPEKTWTDIPVAKPSDRITIHYHRYDGRYDGVVLWTWDSHQKNTPKENEIAPLGRDAFGAVFQIDRARYGGSDAIGIIPRVGHDWNQKDGTDKIWRPALGGDLWLVFGKDEIFAQAPDISPRVDAAFIDAPEKVVVRLSAPVSGSARVSIRDERNETQKLAQTAVVNPPGGAPPVSLAVTPAQPLDFFNHTYTVSVEGFAGSVPLTPRGLLDDRAHFFDPNAQLGAIYTPQATTFRLFAPTAKTVNVVLYDEAAGEKGRALRPLARAQKGLWDATVSGDLRGKFYTLTLDGPELDPAREVLDDSATNAVASSTRGRITPPAETNPPGWMQGKNGPRPQSPVDMVVYEMHVRDFTIAPNSGVRARGKYLGFTEPNTRLPGDAQVKTGLDHLSELGVTHVQLMPVQDFANDEAAAKYNWGYITTAFFSPEGMYASSPADDSRVRELKALIGALHARGIGVIMDVVYNHTADNAPFPFLVPNYYYRTLPDGRLANGSGCGNEFRTEAPMARKYVLDSLKFWAREYGVDGFRFDLMALIDTETMREAERELHAINPAIAIYGEPWAAGDTPLRDKTDKAALRSVPAGAFNDDFRNALKGSPDGSDPGFIQTGANRAALQSAMQLSPWLSAPGQSVNYMTCHDNLVLYDKLKASMSGATEEQLIETMKLGYLALFTAQGVPFFQSGEEFARTKGGNNNSYDAPDSVNEIDWALKRKNLALFQYTRDAISLRKAHPVFRLRTREEIAARLRFENPPDAKTLVFTFDAAGVRGETWKKVCVILNSGDRAETEVPLPPGRWEVAFDSGGAARGGRAVSGKASVRWKSGLVLYQR